MRLLQSKQQKAEKVQAFAEEIELSASLVHSSIVEFIGVAWNTLSNLVMVLEFFPKWNLQKYLHQSGGQPSWSSDKITLAAGIARALDYLHARTPPLIHRDLNSNNILLTEALDPKLIDFGVSRRMVDLTMTAGVGTPYWTAPEILEGGYLLLRCGAVGVGHRRLDRRWKQSEAVPDPAERDEGHVEAEFLDRLPSSDPAHRSLVAPADRPTGCQLIRDLESTGSN